MKTGRLATLARDIQRGHCSAQEHVAAQLRAARGTFAPLNAWASLHAEAALQAAGAVDAARAAGQPLGPLAGLPLAVKDNIAEAGVPCAAACRAYRTAVAAADAPVVARLRAAGAVILGRTNMHELADGVTCEQSAYGPVHHPARPGYHPGGSSGGSAVVVAVGLVAAALGTDTGGSIRIPASLCGVVGFKASRGAIPVEGVVPLSTSLDHVGPLAATVADAALLFHVLSASAGPPAPPVALDRPPRLGVLEAWVAEAEPAVAERFGGVLRALEREGATLRSVRLPALGRGVRLLSSIYPPEAAAYHAARLAERPDDFGPDVRADLERGLRFDPARRTQALAEAEALAAALTEAMAGLDALVSPTTPRPATPFGAPEAHRYLQFTSPFNLTGQPALSLPMRPIDGLPSGLQVVGRRGADEALLRLAATIEEPVAEA